VMPMSRTSAVHVGYIGTVKGAAPAVVA
jgi:hypothetical protein